MELIDLTYDIHEGMLTFAAPWHPLVSIQQIGRIDVEGRDTRKISFGTHTGTHIDAPLHFIKNGMTIEKIPLTQICGNVTIIEFTHLKRNQIITKKMLEKIQFSPRIIFKFGWGKNWGTPKFYENYPFFSKEAANFLVKKKVKLIGMDTPSPDGSIKNNEDSPIHKIFLRNKVILLEYIANLNKVKDLNNWKIIVAPLKIRSADGAPSRVFLYR